MILNSEKEVVAAIEATINAMCIMFQSDYTPLFYVKEAKKNAFEICIYENELVPSEKSVGYFDYHETDEVVDVEIGTFTLLKSELTPQRIARNVFNVLEKKYA